MPCYDVINGRNPDERGRGMKYSATYKDGVYIAESVKAHANEAERTAYVRTRPYTVKVTAKCARYLMSKAGK